MNQPSTDRWAAIKQNAPTIFMVVCVLSFMNARDAGTAGIFGTLGVIGLVWIVRKTKQRPKELGEPLMVLGQMTSVGPTRMSPWYGLAVLAFGLLSVVTFFSLAEASLPKRLALPLISISIVGTFLVMLNPKLRRFGTAIFGIGFTLAGVAFAWAAVDAVQTRSEGFALEATKCAVFAAFLLMPGLVTVSALLFRSGRTPLYPSGLTGPHGFVPWTQTERLEMTENSGKPLLAVGAYGGWTLLIDVDDSQRDDVIALIESVGNHAANPIPA